jgi:hypothetical protein
MLIVSTSSSESLPRAESPPSGEGATRPRFAVRPHLREALALLLQAFDYALDLDQDAWDLAVELHVLRGAKLNNSDIRWLAAKGYIEHALELTGPGDVARHFRRMPLLTFAETECFVLTRSGEAVARELCSGDISTADNPASNIGICQIAPVEEVQVRPKWDPQRRQLRLGSEVIKEFKLPSPNQETVLTAFEEEGWPPRIDDPLPPQEQLDPRRRLHDTIKALNRKQKRCRIRFRGDGSGEGIRWEPYDPELAVGSL